MKSQSALTRRVFRAILANRPYHSASCPLRCTSAALPHNAPPRSQHARRQQRRSFFGVAIGGFKPDLAAAKSTTDNIETALERLSEFVEATRANTRPPQEEKLVEAIRFFVKTRLKAERGLKRNEVFLVAQSLNHLIQEKWVSDDDTPKTLGAADLLDVLRALSLPVSGEGIHRSDIQELARAVRDELKHHDVAAEDAEMLFASALASSGAAEEAWSVMRTLSVAEYDDDAWTSLWIGLAAEGKQKLMLEHTDIHDFDHTGTVSSSVLRYLCKNGDLQSAKELLQLARDVGGLRIEGTALSTFLQYCVDAKQPLPDKELNKSEVTQPGASGAFLSWRAARGASTQELAELMQEMLQNGAEIDMSDMNQLVKYAYIRKDTALAASYIQLAQEAGAVPDAETYALKLDYDVSAGDLNAAREAFEGMCIQDMSTTRSDVPALNRYIRMLAAQDADYQLIMRVVAQIAAVLKEYIVNPAVKDQNAFNAYEMFRGAFPETPRSERLLIMDSFFERKRSDLACLVFAHMRMRQDDVRPDDEAYAQCFYGIAKCRDVDGLQQVYNMLKLDVRVQQTTKVHNAMMAAYVPCQTPFSAIIDHYWKILDSREGPTLSTFKLALRACEAWVGAGGEEARRIMALMQKWDLIITKDLYECYIGALAGQSQFENVIELIECMEEDIGVPPDATTIGTFYNTIPWQYRKDEVEAWARKRYPELWEDLEAMGDWIDEEWEVRYFNINRDIEVDDELLFGRGEYDPRLAESVKMMRIAEPVVVKQTGMD
ncbi:Complex I intermediate-associated protein 84, mitochondrial [Cyphellophora attinorum]|uniref:Complex I intermediate-associated protein 84, mitochondrial n=1 Tax=Cyphellophora attinorum TaxID=1664694 RepID=A0A0N0NM22_9EURO|nr:Complex I intermediate-associated protein 84, mitochondrial [Phialophora attinorum]KPI39961.1 Complex I intermediate-associated protein 84, mitochondrial [Phialophora attinorum]